MYKQANLSFSVTAQAYGDDVNAIQFSTQDKNSAKLVFSIKEGKAPLNLADVDGIVDLVMGDKSVFEGNKAEVTGPLEGKLEYAITPEQIRHPGKARGELKLVSKSGQAIGGFRFAFTIKKALLDEFTGPIKEFYIEDIEAVKKEVKEKADAIVLDIDEFKGDIDSRTTAIEEQLNSLDEDVAQSTVLQVDAAKKDTTGQTHANLDSRIKAEVGKITTKQTELTTQLADTITLKPNGENDKSNWDIALSQLASGGKLYLTHGDYYISEANLRSNMIISGRGYPRILSDQTIFRANSGSSDTKNNITNITFEYITFEAITKTFSQYIHLLALSGVSDITFRHCIFKGFRGDGVYLGSGDVGQERHNKNINFFKCVFDGVNNQNRNGISVVDGENVMIDECVFKNTTVPNMPGAIDLEPNKFNWHILKNITVRKCVFENIGGNTGAIGMYLPLSQEEMLYPAENIEFSGNVVKGTKDTESGIFARQANTANITKQTKAIVLKIADNQIEGSINYGAFITGFRNVILQNNQYKDNKNGVVIGSSGVGNNMIDLKIKENEFKKQSSPTGASGGILLYSAEYVDIIGNTFDDCRGSGIAFMAGTTKYVKHMRNRYLSPTGFMIVSIEKKADHIFTPSTNTDKDNIFDGVTANFFESHTKDFMMFSDIGGYDTNKLPDSFGLGESISVVNGDSNLPSVNKQGILKTIRPTLSSGYRRFTIQFYYPANNDETSATEIYFRKANNSTNDWTAWKKITGI